MAMNVISDLDSRAWNTYGSRDAILPTFSGYPDFSSVQCENEIRFSLFEIINFTFACTLSVFLYQFSAFGMHTKYFFMNSFTLLPSKVKIWKYPFYVSGFVITLEWHLWVAEAEKSRRKH